ncbi:MAG: GH92 family glycosyl hydrolase [Luteolibacter sp.]
MNYFKTIPKACLTAIVLMAAGQLECRSEVKADLTRYVNPFVGTSGTGHTFPGATTPMGMVQLSPETNNFGWEYSSGYHFNDSTLIGFAHTHLSGTGWMDLGDVLMLPYSGDPERSEYRAVMDKKSEKAEPGYYAVALPEEGIRVELSATEHCGVHRYTFLKGGQSNILLDIQSGLVAEQKLLGTHVLESQVTRENGRTISGYARSKQWVEKKLFFVIELSKPAGKSQFLDGATERRLSLSFDTTAGEVIEARVAISTVSVEGAKRNLNECGNVEFEKVRTAARQKWNDCLSKVAIEGDEEQKFNFYTSMYHLFVQPNNIADVDGRYRGPDDKIHQSATKSYFSTLSIWDTYRAAHPLYTILAPEKDGEIVDSMLAHFDATGMLPIWTLWGQDNFCMIGNHAVTIVADAYFKGILSKDKAEKAYAAIKQSLTKNSWEKYDWSIYDQYGYLPADLVKTESVSRTLESTTDDWCAARMAKALGKDDDYLFFSKRAGFYKNLYDPSSGLMRPKNSDGSWLEPFDPLEFSTGGGKVGHYTEGNAWQYSWHVQHDINGLIGLAGGKSQFRSKLDTLFSMESTVRGEGSVADISGMIGQYVHGNEPSHHVAYLYNYADTPWKTQELIPQILKSQYRNAPDGLCGNDDCGQMSAWYIFSTLGFYPVNPASGVFDIGVPSFASASIKLNGKSFDIKAHGLSPTNKYIKSVKLNGKPLAGYQISYAEIMQGGLLEFEMTGSQENLTSEVRPVIHSSEP